MTDEEHTRLLAKAKKRDYTLDGGEIVRVNDDASIKELRGKFVYVYMTSLAGEELSITYRGEYYEKTILRDEVTLTGRKSDWFISGDHAVFVGSDFYLNAGIKRIIPSADYFVQTYEVELLSSNDCANEKNELSESNIKKLLENLEEVVFYGEEYKESVTSYYRCKWCNTLHKYDEKTHVSHYCDALCADNFSDTKKLFKEGEATQEDKSFGDATTSVVSLTSGDISMVFNPQSVSLSTARIEEYLSAKHTELDRENSTDEERILNHRKEKEIRAGLPSDIVLPMYHISIKGIGELMAIITIDFSNETNMHSHIISTNHSDTTWFQYEDDGFLLYGLDEKNEIEKNKLITTFKAFLEYQAEERESFEMKEGIESRSNPNWLKEAEEALNSNNVKAYPRLLLELDYMSKKAEPLHFAMMMNGTLDTMRSFSGGITQHQLHKEEK